MRVDPSPDTSGAADRERESATKIEPRSTASLIADHLRLAIMQRQFAPGEQLGETDLAERFGVSRGPLREAMQRLVQEGLLQAIRNRGVFVITLSAEDVSDIYVARGVIERGAAALILENDPAGVVARLSEALTVMRAAADSGDNAALSEADQRFHEILVEESGSMRLVRMAATVLVESRLCMNALESRYPNPGDAVDEHAAIVHALRSGDADQVMASLDAHMKRAVSLLTPGRPDLTRWQPPSSWRAGLG